MLSDAERARIDAQIAAHEAGHREDLVRLRSMSLEERGRLVASACAAAATILRSRRAAGLPDVVRTPWPESTWEFFRKHAPNARPRQD
jgi:hypothetical protein